MSKSLQLRANYKARIHELETMLPDGADSLNGEVGNEDIMNYLHRRRVQDGLTNLRTACDFLGIRRGEAVPRQWLEELTDTEQQVFLDYFENRKGYTEIGSLMGLEQMEVKKIFKSSLQQVMKQAGRD
ncbi:sigma factor-like helix-turn-helix DNA-binding protein [Lentibacillus salinarum]|uniref:Sigma factor-like helix-turn-helix DNA-binding protein n=1 Tax=Lentibacillus salinarum TaxID=446820 RepID=A0ABW3ZYX8_9BACI